MPLRSGTIRNNPQRENLAKQTPRRENNRKIPEIEQQIHPPPPSSPPPARVQQPASNQISAQDHFNALYKDLQQPGAFTNKLLRYLRKNTTYSLHKSRRRRFPRRRIVTRFPGQIVQTDLIDMQKLSTKNSGYNYILVVIDCFSKKLWTRPLKSKRGEETANGLRSIFESMLHPVQSLIFDEGLEYVNKYVENLLSEFNIHYYHIRTAHKASTAERVNRTIKEKLWKYFTESGRERWIDILDDIVSNYNKTYHSTIKMAPNDVTWENRETVFKNMFPKIRVRIKCRLAKGDRVRVALFKDIFEKGYTQNWSKDIFTITNVFQSNGVCWYRISDDNGTIYPKLKYFYELNKIE